MSIVNIQRDAQWSDLQGAKTQWSTQQLFSAGSFYANSDGIVHDLQAQISSNPVNSIGSVADSIRCLGCFMKQPAYDTEPYRVKVRASSTATAGTARFYIVVGHAPATITGANDICINEKFYPFQTETDEVIMLPKLPDVDSESDKPIFIGVGFCDNTVGTEYVIAHVSVQRLAVAPPAFSQSTA